MCLIWRSWCNKADKVSRHLLLPSHCLFGSGAELGWLVPSLPSGIDDRISSTASSTNVSATVSSCNWIARPLALPSDFLQLSRLVRIVVSKFRCQDKHWSLRFLRLFLLVFNSHNSRFWAKRLLSDPLNVIPFKYIKVIFNNSRNVFLLWNQDFSMKLYSCNEVASGRKVLGAKHTLPSNPKMHNLTTPHCI